jgi:endonuclease YncB( thermonuclease family)
VRWGIIQYVAVFSAVVGLGVAFPFVKASRVEAAQSSGVAASGPQGNAPQFAGTARIIDGDTLALGEVKIRLHGIDAPEIAQTCSDTRGAIWTCGKWSKATLERLATGSVTCVQKDIDRYGRIVGTCFAQNVNVNAAMVAKGAAFAYVQYSRDYVSFEVEARRMAVGVWRSRVQAPSEYRSAKRAAFKTRQAAAEAPIPEGCAIKGNISKSGHLYHLPGSRWYGDTRINEAHGERWFCSEREAKAAGWRAAQS